MQELKEEYDLMMRKCLCGCGDKEDFEELQRLEDILIKRTGNDYKTKNETK